MAALTGVFGVPHTPAFPKLVDDGVGPAAEIREMYARVRARVEAAEPNVVIVVADDHLNTFFLDNFPSIGIGIGAETWGPNDGTDGLPPRSIPSDPDFASHLLAELIGRGFEPSVVQDFAIDHAMVVPIHFLLGDPTIPVVPLWINELVPPIPTSERAYELGRCLRAAIESYDHERNVVVIGSGSFSLEVGGVHIAPDQNYGVPDPEWTETVVDHMKTARAAELVARATPERLHRAGNVGGELLAWLVAWAAAGGGAPESITVQPQFGHAYASWEVLS
ncbi:hypothetical protein [Microbacterium sp. F2]|uniref:DODA-type extradiol aromatic ring-opening family dioxygenase n=1 Tax=Microbacterium sp. F2 TaxID=3422228 RepID=UPI003FD1C25C